MKTKKDEERAWTEKFFKELLRNMAERIADLMSSNEEDESHYDDDDDSEVQRRDCSPRAPNYVRTAISHLERLLRLNCRFAVRYKRHIW
ncbi:unnamed protein product [Calypogeia fissa]